MKEMSRNANTFRLQQTFPVFHQYIRLNASISTQRVLDHIHIPAAPMKHQFETMCTTVGICSLRINIDGTQSFVSVYT